MLSWFGCEGRRGVVLSHDGGGERALIGSSRCHNTDERPEYGMASSPE